MDVLFPWPPVGRVNSELSGKETIGQTLGRDKGERRTVGCEARVLPGTWWLLEKEAVIGREVFICIC